MKAVDPLFSGSPGRLSSPSSRDRARAKRESLVWTYAVGMILQFVYNVITIMLAASPIYLNCYSAILYASATRYRLPVTITTPGSLASSV